MMPTYVILMLINGHRFYHVWSGGLACTREELKREVCWKVNERPDQCVDVQCCFDPSVAHSIGKGWQYRAER